MRRHLDVRLPMAGAGYEHIASLAGTHLDPAVVQAFFQHGRLTEPTASAVA